MNEAGKGIMKSKIRSIARSLKKTDLVWRYASNFSPTVQFSTRGESTLSVHERYLVGELDRSGIAFTSIDKLLGDGKEFLKLTSAVTQLMNNKSDAIADFRAKANDENAIGDKSFNLELLGSELTFDPDNIFAQFALNQTLLNIANSYFGMYAKLRYYNVWRTFASQSKLRESQLWHYDREDNYILKLFLYLDDVDEGSGPFTYAPGTHKKGKHRSIEPEYFLEGVVRRSTDEQMCAVYPKDRWKRGLGKRGTVIFADTRGFHKGGEARTKDRLMYTCMYTSQASESRRLISFSPNLDLSSFNDQQRRALLVT